MNIPLICELRTGIVYEGEDFGYLVKQLPQEKLDRDFKSLIDYMVDTEIDDLNPIPYNESQKESAKTIIEWYKSADYVDILSPNLEDSTMAYGPYKHTAIVKDHLDEISKIKHKEDPDSGNQIPYKCIDLIIRAMWTSGSKENLSLKKTPLEYS